MAEQLTSQTKHDLHKLAEQEGLSVDAMLQRLIETYQTSTPAIPHELSIDVNRYFGLFEQSNDAVFLLGLDGQHLECNQRAADLLGYTSEEIANLSSKTLVKASEQHESMNAKERLIAGEKIPPYQRTFLHKCGSEIPVELNVECVFDDSGTPLYIQSIARDIRDRLNLEQHIRENEDLYRTILNTMVEGVVIHKPNGEIALVNPSAEALLGLTAEQMKGLTPIDPTWRTIREDGSPFPDEEHPASITTSQHIPQYNVVMGVYKPDSSLTWISITSIPLVNNDGSLRNVIITFSDITDLKHAQKQAINIALERERVNVLAQFMQGASHEFRTPLAIIQTNTYLITRQFDDEALHHYLQKIDIQVNRIDRLVNQLLIMAQLDATYELAHDRRIHVPSFINELLRSYPEKLAKKNLTLHTANANQNVYIQSEGVYLIQAFAALMDNAIAHSHTDREIFLSTEITAETITCIIEDQGSGIPSDDMQHIFKRFWRADLAHSSAGFGLGLPLAKRIIDLHGGTLTLKSTVGIGTTVTVNLPLA